MILLGLLLGQINTDVISGVPRYSFDIPELTDGIGFVAIAMGVFGFGEIISNLGRPAEHREVFTRDVKGLWPTKTDFQEAWPAVLRGTALGSHAGHPARRRCAAVVVCLATRWRRRSPATPACPSARARSRAWPGPRAPTMPGRRPASSPCSRWASRPTPVMALMVGAMTIKGIQPGPQVMTSNPDLFWGLIASMWIGNADADRPQPAADRHLDQAADGALPLPVPGHRAASAASACTR